MWLAEAAERLLNGLRGKARSKSPRGRRGCRCRRVACRRCGKTPLRQRRGWRSSYEPPVRGHRHYRQIVAFEKLDRGRERSAGEDQMVFRLAVIAFLLLFGLLASVVLMFFCLRRWTRLGRSHAAPEFTHPRFHLIDEPDVLVIPHSGSLRHFVAVTQSRRPQADLPHVCWLDPENGQPNRERE